MLNLHIAPWWQYVPNLRSIVLKVYGQVDQYINRCVISEPVQWKELISADAQIIRMGTLFVWPKKFSAMPPLGSVIVDEDGTFWTIWKLVFKDIVDTWEASCLQLSILAGPNMQNPSANLATVLIASYEKSEANEAKAVWRGFFTDQNPAVTDPKAKPTDTIICRFQPLKELSRIQFSSEWTDEQYRAYFSEPWPKEMAGGEYRLVDNVGNRYRIMDYFDEMKLDRLPCATCVRITEGEEFFQDGRPQPYT